MAVPVVAIIGRPNVGKSSLFNALAGEMISIVEPTAGVTRDRVSTFIGKDEKYFELIDTGGYGVVDTDHLNSHIEQQIIVAIESANLVLFMVDIRDGVVPLDEKIARLLRKNELDVIGVANKADNARMFPAAGEFGKPQVDKKVARFIAEECKSCILVVNKWDLAKETAVTGDYEEYLTKLLPGLKYAPIAFTTATEAKNVHSVLDLAAEIFKQTTTWIPTAKLNKAFEIIKAERVSGVKRRRSAKAGKAGWPKIYYVTQIAVNPITILMFVNKPELFEENYRRLIINRLRELLPVEEVPIRLLARSHRK